MKRVQLARHSGEEGTALVLALLVVLLVGAMLAAVLEYTRTGLLIAPGAANERNSATYAQGAVEGAVNAIRGSTSSGRSGWPCPTYEAPASSEVGVNGHTYRVTCEGQGVPTTNPDGDAQPDFAIQTLGTGGARGINQTGNSELAVIGGIYSNDDIAITAGIGNDTPQMNVYGTVFAEGSCTTSRIISTDDLSCPSFEDTTGIGEDPQWPASVPDQAALEALIAATDADPAPVCDGAVMVFGPGYYSQNPDQLATRYGVDCSVGNQSTVLLFTPGFYYFDYDELWDMEGEKIVGGTRAAGLSAREMGVACDPTQPGVQFVFGGTSRFNVAGDSSDQAQGVELCAPTAAQNELYQAGFRQRISLYGSVSGQAERTTGSSELTAEVTAQAPEAAVVLDRDAVREIDGTSALVTARSGRTTTVTLSDFDVFDTVPEGATVDRITVRYAQAPAPVGLLDAVNLTGVPKSVGLSLVAGGTRYPTAAVGTDLDCPQGCEATVVPDAASAPVWRDLEDLALEVAVQGPNGNNRLGAMQLDGFEVLVEWTAPTLRPLTCPDDEPDCALISSGTNPRIHMHGTVYAPTSRLDLRVHNTGDTVFARGIVVRTLDVDVSASTKQFSAPFQLPGGTPAGRKVLFKAYLDDAVAPVVRACVTYVDAAPLPDGGGAAFPGWSLDVHRWVALRSPADGNSCQGTPDP